MRAITAKLIWFISGVFITHAGYFIYQKCYAGHFAAVKLSECIAMVIEDLLKLLFQFLDQVLPLLVVYKLLILGVLALLVLMMISFVWLKIYFRIKNHYRYNAKIKEAEMVLAAAKQKAAGQTKKIETLKEKLTAEFEKKDNALQTEVKEKLKKYIVRIKRLEKEQMELKETNGSLMRKVETT